MPPPPISAKKSQQFGRTFLRTDFFRQNSFPVAWILVPGPKHTFLLVAVVRIMLNRKASLNFRKENFHPLVCAWSLSSNMSVRQWSSGACPGSQRRWWWFHSWYQIILHFLSPVLMRKLVFNAQTKPASVWPSSMHQDGKALGAPFDHLTCAGWVCSRPCGSNRTETDTKGCSTPGSTDSG